MCYSDSRLGTSYSWPNCDLDPRGKNYFLQDFFQNNEPSMTPGQIKITQ